MNWLKKAWTFVDGNKTKVGAVLVAIGKLATYLGYPQFGGPLEQLGEAVASVGLVHAGMKALDAPITDNSPVAKEVRQITASADIYKPGMRVKGYDGKVMVIRRLVRGGGKDSAGSVEFIYDADVVE